MFCYVDPNKFCFVLFFILEFVCFGEMLLEAVWVMLYSLIYR